MLVAVSLDTQEDSVKQVRNIFNVMCPGIVLAKVVIHLLILPWKVYLSH